MPGLFDQKAVGITSSHLGPENGQDEGEEKSHKGQSNAGKDPPFAYSPFSLGCLCQQDHPEHNGSVQGCHEVRLRNKLTLLGPMDVGHSLLSSLDEWWTSDVIPHLSTDHGEYEHQSQHAPRSFILKEL